MSGPISITLVTGFLGSGKTTFIRHLLADPFIRGAVVIVNDLAPIGLDHLLLKEGSNEPILLANGCICCTVNKDLGFTLLDLLRRLRSGEISSISQVIIETTGTADPIPIMRLLAANPAISETYALDRVVAILHAHHGRSQLERYSEARLQVAVADFILISHGDDADDIALLDDIGAINPVAEIIGKADLLSAERLVSHTRFNRIPDSKILLATGASRPREAGIEHSVTVACITASRPIQWDRLVSWVEGLGDALGDNLLRIKGTVTISGEAAPVFINGVQDRFYPPTILPDWFDPTGGSQLIVIGHGIDPTQIEAEFRRIVAP